MIGIGRIIAEWNHSASWRPLFDPPTYFPATTLLSLYSTTTGLSFSTMNRPAPTKVLVSSSLNFSSPVSKRISMTVVRTSAGRTNNRLNAMRSIELTRISKGRALSVWTASKDGAKLRRDVDDASVVQIDHRPALISMMHSVRGPAMAWLEVRAHLIT